MTYFIFIYICWLMDIVHIKLTAKMKNISTHNCTTKQTSRRSLLLWGLVAFSVFVFYIVDLVLDPRYDSDDEEVTKGVGGTLIAVTMLFVIVILAMLTKFYKLQKAYVEYYVMQGDTSIRIISCVASLIVLVFLLRLIQNCFDIYVFLVCCLRNDPSFHIEALDQMYLD